MTILVKDAQFASAARTSAVRRERNPALDGIRALAVTMVVLHHAYPQEDIGGFVGVDLFFVLSGFLITGILLEQRARYGWIKLGEFYSRRALRLLPPLAVLTTAITVFSATLQRGWWSLDTHALIWVATYTGNWFNQGWDLYAHTWSLAVEEQFYLIWPLAMIALTRVVGSRRGLVMSFAGLSFISAAWQVFMYHHGASGSRLYDGTDTHSFGLLLGATLAVGLTVKRLRPARIAVLASWAVVLWMITKGFNFFEFWNGGYIVVQIATLFIVWDAATARRAFLSSPPMAYVGRISYGVYLWHYPLILAAFSNLHWYRWLVPAAAMLSYPVAAVSFKYLERPLLEHCGWAARLPWRSRPPDDPVALN